jgi:hypothetical protein
VSLQLRRSVRASVFNLRDLSGLCVSFSQPGNGPFSVALFKEHHTEGTKVTKVSLQLRRSVRVSVFNLRDLSGLCVSFSQPGNGPFSVALFKEHHTAGTKVTKVSLQLRRSVRVSVFLPS